MDEQLRDACPRSPDISTVVKEIGRLFHSAQIYLFSHKLNGGHQVASFKLCVIYDFEDKAAAERAIYLDIDSGVPFDVVLYTRAEWMKLSADPHSFAHRVIKTGFVVHD